MYKRQLIDGVDVREYDLKALREMIGVVLQKNVLFSGTIEENIRWGKKDATHEEIVAACKASQADAFVNEQPDGYNTYLSQEMCIRDRIFQIRLTMLLHFRVFSVAHSM